MRFRALRKVVDIRERRFHRRTRRLKDRLGYRRQPVQEERRTFGKILVVDDKRQFRKENAQLVEMLGYSPLIAESGTEAIRIYEENIGSVSLVILDYNMPGMNGDEVLRRLKEIDPGVNVVICSNGLNTKKINDVLSQGAKTFIPKPIIFSELKGFVDAFFGQEEAQAAG